MNQDVGASLARDEALEPVIDRFRPILFASKAHSYEGITECRS